ncbi:MAG: hypothetical protein WCS28_02400 [Thiomicrospira sp.]
MILFLSFFKWFDVFAEGGGLVIKPESNKAASQHAASQSTEPLAHIYQAWLLPPNPSTRNGQKMRAEKFRR